MRAVGLARLAAVVSLAAGAAFASSSELVHLQFLYRPGANFANAPGLGTFAERSLYVAPLAGTHPVKGPVAIGSEGLGADRRPVFTGDSLQDYALDATRATFDRWGARMPGSEDAAHYVLRVGLVRAFVSERSAEYRGQIVLRLTLEDADRRTVWSGQVVGVGFAEDRAEPEQRFNEALGAAVVDALSGFVSMPALEQPQEKAKAVAPSSAPAVPPAIADAGAMTAPAPSANPEAVTPAPQGATDASSSSAAPAVVPEASAPAVVPDASATAVGVGAAAAGVLAGASSTPQPSSTPPPASETKPEMSGFEQPPISEVKPAPTPAPAAAAASTTAAATTPKPRAPVSPTALLEELTKLKKAGMSDDTLLAFVKQREIVRSELSADDVLAYYQAGMSDAIVKAVLAK